MQISARAFQRIFTCKIWLRYSRKRALQSLPDRAVQQPSRATAGSSGSGRAARCMGLASRPLLLLQVSATAFCGIFIARARSRVNQRKSCNEYHDSSKISMKTHDTWKRHENTYLIHEPGARDSADIEQQSIINLRFEITDIFQQSQPQI